jgi:hypothetical protein
MPDRVDASVLDVQPTRSDTEFDGAASDPEPQELPARDAPMLPAGEVGDQRVDRRRTHFAIDAMVKCVFDGHGRQRGREIRAWSARNVTK